MKNNLRKLSIIPLSGLVVGSMVGSGVFDLPKNMVMHSGGIAIIISWIISGLGMLTLAFTFQSLAIKKKNIEGSIYGYAREGFGDYVGFNSAFGYWLSALIGNVSYFYIIFAALGYFYPIIFGNGGNLTSIISGSIVLWCIFFFILKGVNKAVILDNVITLAKLIPLIFFIVIIIINFKLSIFKININPNFVGSLLSQIKSTMLITVWVYLGVEGASVFSTRAKKSQDVAKATLIGFLISITLFILISVTSLGIVSRDKLLNIATPSTAGILNQLIGYSGILIINVAIIVAVLGCLLSWTLLSTEMPYLAAKNYNFPNIFSKVNKNNTPIYSLIIGTSLVQILLVISYFSSQTYYSLINLSASMAIIPYFITALYFMKEIIISKNKNFNKKELLVSVIASIYGLWLIYASGLKYILLSMILYGCGIVLFVLSRIINQKVIFKNTFEKILAFIILILFIIAFINFKNLI